MRENSTTMKIFHSTMFTVFIVFDAVKHNSVCSYIINVSNGSSRALQRDTNIRICASITLIKVGHVYMITQSLLIRLRYQVVYNVWEHGRVASALTPRRGHNIQSGDAWWTIKQTP